MDRDLLRAALLVLVTAQGRVERDPVGAQVGDGIGEGLADLRAVGVEPVGRVHRVVGVEGVREDRRVGDRAADRGERA